MAQKLLIVILSIAALFEFAFAAAGFVAPDFTLQQFQIASSPETLFLGYIIAWFLLVVAAICAYCLKRVWTHDDTGYILARILGFWWVGIGIGIFVKFGRPDNLFLDSLKGLLIVALSFAAQFTARIKAEGPWDEKRPEASA